MADKEKPKPPPPKAQARPEKPTPPQSRVVKGSDPGKKRTKNG